MKALVLGLISTLVIASAAQAEIVCSGTINDKAIVGTLVLHRGQQMFVIQDAKTNLVQKILLVERTKGKGNYSGMVLDRDGMPLDGQDFDLLLRTLAGQRSILNINAYGEREVVDLSCSREVDSTKHALVQETN